MAKNRKYSTRISPGIIRKEYRAWKAMKARCYAPCNKNDGNYQSLGIQVCDRWKNSFDNFMNDMKECPEGFTLDRIDPNKDYSPENCRWADWNTQATNRGTFNKIFTHSGETMVLKNWAKKFNIKYSTLHRRIYRSGLTFEEAIQSDPFNKLIEYKKEVMTITNWAIKLKVKPQILVDRIRRGWTIEEAFETPVNFRLKK